MMEEESDVCLNQCAKVHQKVRCVCVVCGDAAVSLTQHRPTLLITTRKKKKGTVGDGVVSLQRLLKTWPCD